MGTKEKFISVLKVSLFLALINIGSSTICFSILLNVPNIWWLWGFDYAINAFCTFLMMGNDRRLLTKMLCYCINDQRRRRRGDHKENSKSDKSENASSTAPSHPTLKSMDTLKIIEQIEMEQQGGDNQLLNVVSASEDNDSDVNDMNMSDSELQEEQQQNQGRQEQND